MHYSVTVQRVDTSAVVATFKTFLGLKAAATAGHRGRLRSISVAPSGEAAQDVNVAVQVSKTDNTADGTSTGATVKNKDADARASIMTAGINYTVEPTTVDSQHFWEGGINGRGALIKTWAPEEAPRWGVSETLVIRLAPGTTSAVKMSVTAEWEEF